MNILESAVYDVKFGDSGYLNRVNKEVSLILQDYYWCFGANKILPPNLYNHLLKLLKEESSAEVVSQDQLNQKLQKLIEAQKIKKEKAYQKLLLPTSIIIKKLESNICPICGRGIVYNKASVDTVSFSNCDCGVDCSVIRIKDIRDYRYILVITYSNENGRKIQTRFRLRKLDFDRINNYTKIRG